MSSVNLLYRSVKEKANLSIRLLFSHNGKAYSFEARTKLDVEKDYWLNKHELKRPRDITISNEQIRINTEFNSIKTVVLENFNKASIEEINKKWLQQQLENYYNPITEDENLPNELLKYYELYIELKEKDVSTSSLKKFKSTLKLVERFQKFKNRKYLISDVDLIFKKDFEDYCLNEGSYALNTTSRAVKFIKSVCFHAKSHGIEVSYQLDSIKVKFYKTDIIYLTSDEIKLIGNLENISTHLDNNRDWLIISCYTGQRVSDFLRFTKDMIRDETNKDGRLISLIEFTQKKTAKIMTVALLKKVKEVLKKRGGNFPKAISAQRYNDSIKQICKLAGINTLTKGSKKLETFPGSKKYRKTEGEYEKWELVSSRIGRRSYASNLYGRIPTINIMSTTGHQTEKMFLTYIGKSNKDIAIETFSYLDSIDF